MTLCLNMIVKDEAHVIARALVSARPFIDSWCIVDTGSKDDTAEEIHRALEGVPGKLYHREWKGFGPARTEALGLARDHGDYAIVIDADEILSGSIDGPLTAPGYGLWMRWADGNRARTHRVFCLDKPWQYVGAIHEYPHCSEPWDIDAILPNLTLSTPQDGVRSLDPQKHQKMAAALEEMLSKDPTSERLVFHLGLAWRDAGEDERAVNYFLQRTKMPHGINGEEIYISYLEAGRAQERLGRSNEAIASWMRAHAVWPERCEAPRDLWRQWLWRASISKDVGTLYNEFNCSTELVK